jgi:hypothetical protein
LLGAPPTDFKPSAEIAQVMALENVLPKTVRNVEAVFIFQFGPEYQPGE